MISCPHPVFVNKVLLEHSYAHLYSLDIFLFQFGTNPLFHVPKANFLVFKKTLYKYVPTRNAEEAEVEWFYEDLQHLLELTPEIDTLFITGDWNAK